MPPNTPQIFPGLRPVRFLIPVFSLIPDSYSRFFPDPPYRESILGNFLKYPKIPQKFFAAFGRIISLFPFVCHFNHYSRVVSTRKAKIFLACRRLVTSTKAYYDCIINQQKVGSKLDFCDWYKLQMVFGKRRKIQKSRLLCLV